MLEPQITTSSPESYGGGAAPYAGTMPYGVSSAESGKSAVSWPAVIGGAVVATAITLLLTILGASLGLGSVSLFNRGDNPSATTFTAMAAIWLIIVQWISAGLGGYLTGRMRMKWVDTHTDEVFFRDTANGFLSWALATMLAVGLLSSALGSLVSGTSHAVGGAASAAVQRTSASDVKDGMVDALLRPATPNANGTTSDVHAEVARILTSDPVSAEDRQYLSQLVAARAGISQPDAEKRVDQAIAKRDEAAAKAKQVAEASRKATSGFLLYAFISMLIGAFIASAAAALGGHERDAVKLP